MVSLDKNQWRSRKIELRPGHIMAVAALVVAAGFGLAEAADSDLSTTMSGPAIVGPGAVATITFGYMNDGPDAATSAYANAYIPSGVPAPIDQLTQAQLDFLEASATADTLGNKPLLFIDGGYCEHLLFQVQRDDGDTNADPIVGLGVGVSDTVTFDLEIPMTAPEIGAVIIDQPASLAKEYKPAVVGDHVFNAAAWGRYSRGADCDAVTTACENLTDCFGPRVSLLDPIVGEFELVDDGTATPTYGCDPLIGFTPTNIAVIERGGCEFGVKALNAQNAGAPAVFFVNDGRCGTGNPDSDVCVLNMGGGVVGDQVTIPVVMVSVVDGAPIITELNAGTTVNGRIGAAGSSLTLDGTIFLTGLTDTDPVPTNNESTFDLMIDDGSMIFTDGFESGDLSAWTSTNP
jgi:hypothetical protein